MVWTAAQLWLQGCFQHPVRVSHGGTGSPEILLEGNGRSRFWLRSWLWLGRCWLIPWRRLILCSSAGRVVLVAGCKNLYRKGMILPSSLGTGRFDTLATDWKQCKGGLFGQLDYKLEILCQPGKGAGHMSWARRHQASGSGFCWCWSWMLWCCQAKSGCLTWSGQHLNRPEGTSRPRTRWQYQMWQQSSFLPPVWLWPEALLDLQNILLLSLSVLWVGEIALFPFILPTSDTSSMIHHFVHPILCCLPCVGLICHLNQSLAEDFSGVPNSVSVGLSFHFFINDYMRQADVATFVYLINLESGPIYK